jgi:hypothetical protein
LLIIELPKEVKSRLATSTGGCHFFAYGRAKVLVLRLADKQETDEREEG